MKRRYNSKRREESAARTRQEIIDAAVRLHGRGITTVAAVAEEAGVALPTVTKYFPTREHLFHACTSHFAASLPFPSPEALAAIADPGERLLEGVRQIFALHELAYGQAWTGYRLEDESAVLAESMVQYDRLVAEAARAILGDDADEQLTRFVIALLSGLAYRALRRNGSLDPDSAARYMARTLAAGLGVALPPAGEPTRV